MYILVQALPQKHLKVSFPKSKPFSCKFNTWFDKMVHQLLWYWILQTWGSISRTVLRALDVSWWIRPAYCTVVELSSVDRMGIPKEKTKAPHEPSKVEILRRIYKSKWNKTLGCSCPTFLVDNDYSDNTLVGLNSLQSFLYFGLQITKVIIRVLLEHFQILANPK
jgi:hypothetical protein